MTATYTLDATLGWARAGTLLLPHGAVPTPAFMPVGTRGAVKGVAPWELAEQGTAMVLSNTYHLWVRPGHDTIRALGGLHTFMGWSGPLLTDSGGFQVFSLARHADVDEDGVEFRSPEDGLRRRLRPETAVEVQEALGVDVAMALDVCLEHPASRERAAEVTARTTRWLGRCLAARRHSERTALFGIVQGGTYEDLRVEHADELGAMSLDGYAIGGLSVGEDRDTLLAMAGLAAGRLPLDRVRYLMGVGHPVDLVDAVRVGVDLFDCVLPTRAGRHGHAYTSVGRLNLKNARHARDPGPLDPACSCATCTRFGRGYLRAMFQADEMLGKRLLTVHNLAFYQTLVASLRAAIVAGDEARLDRIRAMAAIATARAATTDAG